MPHTPGSLGPKQLFKASWRVAALSPARLPNWQLGYFGGTTPLSTAMASRDTTLAK